MKILEIIYTYISLILYMILKIVLKLPFIKQILSKFKEYEKDLYRQPVEMIISAGYTVEVHYIETEDGYINTAWRVGKKNI